MAETTYVDITLGFDRMEAIVIAERCKAEGLDVALRLMDDNGNAPGLSHLFPHRLTTRADDADAVRAIVAVSHEPAPLEPMQRRHPIVWAITAVVAVMITAAIISGVLDIVA